MDRDILALLAEIRDEQRAIRKLLERRQVLSPRDRTVLEKVLPAIAGAKGSGWFTVAELLKGSDAGVRHVLIGISQSLMGGILRRGEGVNVNGYVVEKAATERGARLWRVVAAME